MLLGNGGNGTPIRRIFTMLAMFAVLGMLVNWVWVIRTNSPTSFIAPYGSEIPNVLPADPHPIQRLMLEADQKVLTIERTRSRTFSETVTRYRKKYGRHPPPGFDKWYRFARERGIWNVDDFDQIWHDLRPYWRYSPKELRRLVRGICNEERKVAHLSCFTLRNGKVTPSDQDWRATEFKKMLEVIKGYLPDMDIAMNRMDQPRVIVPWEDMQAALKVEESSRALPSIDKVRNEFTKIDLTEEENAEEGPLPTGEWFGMKTDNYMDLANVACPPESYARNPDTMSRKAVEATYKLESGFVKNFNLSSDLCTVGPIIKDKHGFLFSPSSVSASNKLIPIFGECKVNINSDILFPANMYYKNDPRYVYNPSGDIPWPQKSPTSFWRGITSGGVQTPENWRNLHRHRFVLLSNSTELSLSSTNTTIFSPITNSFTSSWSPVEFVKKHLDAAFPRIIWCVPDVDCAWLKTFLSTVPKVKLTDTFRHKFLPDIDGHSFSGRWHAFLKSRSLGIKATIFREWHDERLVPWRHFVPLDNTFEEFYSLMVFFLRGPGWRGADEEAARMAEQGREWAGRVLRREDIEVYMLRLMLEYARLLDDERDTVGYAGTGEEVSV
ncbi:hypothetical protein EX30DRAFT_396219 [Ascodesmis nigricans]|uniref:Glycosyl transferase CAP10 domain-containing protein n=1 Tax=Ascodesmis nigricans TaxID=341454 RepID=A0A4S2MVH0_9PEZI|nr:hypothetical protein EX30DRAFT_396219 [Ascodesmis nigricans]